jgi:hemerythrin-like domain-containing protein
LVEEGPKVSKAIDDLKKEHDAILSALQILESMNGQMAAGTKVPREDIAGFVGFLKEFADKCHHGKEEGILFPALTKAGVSEQGGPVGVMLSEHAQGRQLIKDMETAVFSTPDYGQFVKSAEGYSSLLKAHIQKENNVLFPTAEKVLAGGQLEDIYDQFEEHEEKVIGQGRHEELHKMLKDLKKKYPDKS